MKLRIELLQGWKSRGKSRWETEEGKKQWRLEKEIKDRNNGGQICEYTFSLNMRIRH